MSDIQLLFVGVCLVLFGFLLGAMAYALARHWAGARRHKPLSYQGNVRRTLGVLQQLQVLIGREAAEGYPSLADLVRLIWSVQREFGRNASLECVIQALVAQDIEQQLLQRKQQRTKPHEGVSAVMREAVAL